MSGTQPQHPKAGDFASTAVSESSADAQDVADITSGVINVSLQEEGEPEISGDTEMVSKHFEPLPKRDERSRVTRVRSMTSFVSCPSTPSESTTTVSKSVRPINSYFTPIVKPTPPIDGNGPDGNDEASSNTNDEDNVRAITPNILEGLILNDGANVPKPVLTSSQTDSEQDARGAKRKRHLSRAVDNYEVSNTNTNDKTDIPDQVNLIPEDMDEMAKMLFEESGRPAITVTSQVSDNRSTDSNALSVSFQIPVRTPEKYRQNYGPAGPSTSAQKPIDLGTPWMRPLEQDYYNTARASVVAEVRAKHRSKMLEDLTHQGIIAPWALHVAPMPVYLHPHAAKIADIMKRQALEFQVEIGKMLHDHAVFQAERVAVDKVSLRNIFSLNENGYKKSIGALFDARTKVQHELKEQMYQYIEGLRPTESQVSSKELTSMVRGKIPQKYSHNNTIALSSNDVNEQPIEPVGSDRRVVVINRNDQNDRGRSRSRSRRRGRSNSRPPPKRRQYQDNGYYEDNYNRQPRPGNDNYNYKNARPQDNYMRQQDNRDRRNNWQEQPPRPRYPPQDNQYMPPDNHFNPGVFTPDLIQRIAEAYDGLHQ